MVRGREASGLVGLQCALLDHTDWLFCYFLGRGEVQTRSGHGAHADIQLGIFLPQSPELRLLACISTFTV